MIGLVVNRIVLAVIHSAFLFPFTGSSGFTQKQGAGLDHGSRGAWNIQTKGTSVNRTTVPFFSSFGLPAMRRKERIAMAELVLFVVPKSQDCLQPADFRRGSSGHRWNVHDRNAAFQEES
jgi:hypothetical protein